MALFGYWTSQPDRFWAPHVRHDVSNLFEGPWIVLWREKSRFGLLFSLTLTKKRPFFFFKGYFRLIFGFKTDLSALSDQTLSPTCQTRCINPVWRHLYRALTGGVLFRINIQHHASHSHSREKGSFFLKNIVFWLFWLIFGYRADLPDQTTSPTCQTRCI